MARRSVVNLHLQNNVTCTAVNAPWCALISLFDPPSLFVAALPIAATAAGGTGQHRKHSARAASRTGPRSCYYGFSYHRSPRVEYSVVKDTCPLTAHPAKQHTCTALIDKVNSQIQQAHTSSASTAHELNLNSIETRHKTSTKGRRCRSGRQVARQQRLKLPKQIPVRGAKQLLGGEQGVVPGAAAGVQLLDRPQKLREAFVGQPGPGRWVCDNGVAV